MLASMKLGVKVKSESSECTHVATFRKALAPRPLHNRDWISLPNRADCDGLHYLEGIEPEITQDRLAFMSNQVGIALLCLGQTPSQTPDQVMLNTVIRDVGILALPERVICTVWVLGFDTTLYRCLTPHVLILQQHTAGGNASLAVLI